MSRQHAAPILLFAGSPKVLPSLGFASGSDAVSEADIQALVHDFPEVLPIAEVDSMFPGAVFVCRELTTPAVLIDNLLVTPGGLPVIVECKLWRNPEGRREVVGQILDYAKELSRWSSSDLLRAVSIRLADFAGPHSPMGNELLAPIPDWNAKLPPTAALGAAVTSGGVLQPLC